MSEKKFKKPINLWWVVVGVTFIIIVFPWLFRTNSFYPFMDLTGAGEIGDLIGGVTAPFINGLAAILVYLAFREQSRANNLITLQIEADEAKETKRLQTVKDLIIFDLNKKISPASRRIAKEIEKTLSDTADNDDNNNKKMASLHVDFNTEIFKNIALTDLLLIFSKDLYKIIRIYNLVDYLQTRIPLKISYKYPTDKDSIILVRHNVDEIKRLTLNHKAKIKKELTYAKDKSIPDLQELIKEILWDHDPSSKVVTQTLEDLSKIDFDDVFSS